MDVVITGIMTMASSFLALLILIFFPGGGAGKVMVGGGTRAVLANLQIIQTVILQKYKSNIIWDWKSILQNLNIFFIGIKDLEFELVSKRKK